MERDIFKGVFLVEPIIVGGNQPSFALSKYHITYHYQPGECYFPDEVEEGDWIGIQHLGIYDDGEILASKVSLRLREGGTTERYLSRQLSRYDEDGNELQSYPLHITWSSGELPPVVAGERLDDPDLYDEYFTSYQVMNGYNFNTNVMKANDLDKNDPAQRDTYSKRINHIFSYFNPIGVWKTFRTSDTPVHSNTVLESEN